MANQELQDQEALNREAIEVHRRNRGKLQTRSKIPVRTPKDLSIAYTPGVAAVCLEIKADVNKVYELTGKGNTIVVVTDGSAVLGLGNIGAEAAMPVMEGKCILFKELAGVDAFPLCLRTQKSEEIINIVRNIAPGLGGINLEDIAAPRCFEIDEALQDIGIPVFHDDQHGTAIVVLAAMINAAKVLGKNLADLSVVLNGAGASGIACAKLMLGVGFEKKIDPLVKSVILCDSKGILHPDRTDLNPAKQEITKITNLERIQGGLAEAMKGRDIFIGLSVGECVTKEMVRSMAPDP
ncbi:MAG: NADP-dependent malic enzyme, partial [Nitrospinota bacterium]